MGILTTFGGRGRGVLTLFFVCFLFSVALDVCMLSVQVVLKSANYEEVIVDIFIIFKLHLP